MFIKAVNLSTVGTDGNDYAAKRAQDSVYLGHRLYRSFPDINCMELLLMYSALTYCSRTVIEPHKD